MLLSQEEIQGGKFFGLASVTGENILDKGSRARGLLSENLGGVWNPYLISDKKCDFPYPISGLKQKSIPHLDHPTQELLWFNLCKHLRRASSYLSDLVKQAKPVDKPIKKKSHDFILDVSGPLAMAWEHMNSAETLLADVIQNWIYKALFLLWNVCSYTWLPGAGSLCCINLAPITVSSLNKVSRI